MLIPLPFISMNLSVLCWYMLNFFRKAVASKDCSLIYICLQENPLDFVGDESWVIYENPGHVDGHREEVKAKRTSEGTFPPGSMWSTNPILPHREDGGSDDRGHGHIIDMVKVPDHLEPGDYVLGFRWDSKCSPQVWVSCAYIKLE